MGNREDADLTKDEFLAWAMLFEANIRRFGDDPGRTWVWFHTSEDSYVVQCTEHAGRVLDLAFRRVNYNGGNRTSKVITCSSFAHAHRLVVDALSHSQASE